MENEASVQLYDAKVLKYFAVPSAIFTIGLWTGGSTKNQFQRLQSCLSKITNMEAINTQASNFPLPFVKALMKKARFD